MYRDTDKIW